MTNICTNEYINFKEKLIQNCTTFITQLKKINKNKNRVFCGKWFDSECG